MNCGDWNGVSNDKPITTMPRVLSWVQSDQILNRVQAEYEELLFNSLGYLLGKLIKSRDASATEIKALVDGLNEVSLRRVITAPEASYRLFYWCHQTKEVASFIQTSLAAENYRATNKSSVPENVQWTALGEPCIKTHDQERSQACYLLRGYAPIDLDSPYALNLSLVDGEHSRSKQSPFPYKGVVRATALQHVHSAGELINTISPYADTLVLSFTKVLVLRCDPNNLKGFASSSSGHFTGRSMLINPHTEDAAGATVTNGIVHEAIHSILYMIEKKCPWLSADHLYFDDSARVNSPWTGASLLLRPFLQACFVWYGLVNFWSHTTALAVLPKSEVLSMATRAYAGFANGPLVDCLNPWRNRIDKDVLDTIDAMQSAVRR